MTDFSHADANAHEQGNDAGSAKVGDGISASLSSWTFGDGVYQTFDEHIKRSIPMYTECHDLVIALSDFFVRQGSLVYELGTATGTLACRLAERHGNRARRIIGIDIEPSMIEEATRRVSSMPHVELVEADLLEYAFEPSDFMVSYYTLQFMRVEERRRVIRAVYDSIIHAGAFVLFEKVREPDGCLQDLISQLYSDFKLSSGFTPEEIIWKARSLRSVLEPSTSEENIRALKQAGFSSVGIVHKSLSFEGYLAVK